jgi:muconate cycloisomerase
MKIDRIELFHISIPFAKPYALSKAYGTLRDAHAVIFKVHTDEGAVGLGEADPMNPFTDETPSSVMVVTKDVIAPRLLGQDPLQVATLERMLDQSVHGNLTARGAVNMALHDIAGKAMGIPVHAMLGGRLHSEIPILWGTSSATPAEDIASIEELMHLGCRTVMLKMGALPVSQEIKRLISVRKYFEDDLSLVVDANQGWEVVEAFTFIEGVRGCPLQMIEQPVKHWDLEGLKRIRQRSPCPLSADESLVTIHDAANLVREKAVDVFSIKVSKNGGLTKGKAIAQVAQAFDLKILMNSMLEFGITQAASLHLGCTLSNLLDMGHAYGSVVRMSDDVTDFGQNISGATVKVPDTAGLGVRLDEKKLKQYTKEHLEIKHE